MEKTQMLIELIVAVLVNHLMWNWLSRGMLNKLIKVRSKAFFEMLCRKKRVVA